MSRSSFIQHPSSFRKGSSLRRSVASSLRRSPTAFTIVELLVVLGIIVVLMGILFPVLGKVRQAGYKTKSQAVLTNLASACERYFQDFRAYPGPLSNDQVYVDTNSLAGLNQIHYGANRLQRISMAENLVLGLSGGLEFDSGANRINYVPNYVGSGPKNLAGKTINKAPYIEGAPLSPGHFSDDSGEANDSPIPEFLDGYPEALPVLYLRARVGANEILSDNNNVGGGTAAVRPYDLNQIIAYTGSVDSGAWNSNTGGGLSISTGLPPGGSTIGTGKKLKDKYQDAGGGDINPPAQFHGLRSATDDNRYPMDAVKYLRHPNFNTQPRAKDGFILIVAGPDRIYGTTDDITSFGEVTR